MLAEILLHLSRLGLELCDAGFHVTLRGQATTERLALLANGFGAWSVLAAEFQPEVHLPLELRGGLVVGGEPAAQTSEVSADIFSFGGE